MKQITNNILMIRPVRFRYNEQTAKNNYYQKILDNLSTSDIQNEALSEFDTFVSKLKNIGVNVIVINDTISSDTPDSIFPNNWVSFHIDGSVSLYPMYAFNRRKERRKDILEVLVNQYKFQIHKINDFTYFEDDEKYLEGTGSMVLDRENKICYAALSERTNKDAVLSFCNKYTYSPVLFSAKQTVNNKRMYIYHTNVMMCVADKFVIICLTSIEKQEEKQHVINSIKQSGKEIIEISEKQKNRFAGNMLQVMGAKPYIVMSTSAYNILDYKQIEKIEKYCDILHTSLNVIEVCGGGSARCMIAEIFLPIR